MKPLSVDLTELAARLTEAFPPYDLAQRVASVRSAVCGRVVFTTSFGIEDQAIADAIFIQDLAIEVLTLDTGRLFPQTYELWAETERRYGRRIKSTPIAKASKDWHCKAPLRAHVSIIAGKGPALRRLARLARLLSRAGAALALNEHIEARH